MGFVSCLWDGEGGRKMGERGVGGSLWRKEKEKEKVMQKEEVEKKEKRNRAYPSYRGVMDWGMEFTEGAVFLFLAN